MGLWCVPLVRCRPLARFRSQSTLVVLAGRASNGVRLPNAPSSLARAGGVSRPTPSLCKKRSAQRKPLAASAGLISACAWCIG